jgi:hypothetical protein
MMLILEAAVIILVLHSVSWEKANFNIKTIFTMLVNVIFLAIVNINKLDNAILIGLEFMILKIKISHFLKNVKSTDAYWNKKR